MTILDLQYFSVLSEYGSISSAAEHLIISRQALSKCLEKLERELGGRLVIRSAGGVELTDFGRYVKQHTEEMLQEFEGLAQIHDRFLRDTASTIRILVPENQHKWISAVLTQLEDFRKIRPDCDLQVVQRERSINAMKDLMENYDAVITMEGTLEEEHGIESISIGLVEYELCIGPQHPWYDRAGIPREELCTQRFITERPQFIYDWLKARGVSSDKILFDFGNPDVKNELIDAGLVLGLSSRLYRGRYHYRESIRFVPMDPPARFYMNICYQKAAAESKLILEEFLQYIRSNLENRDRLLTE